MKDKIIDFFSYYHWYDIVLMSSILMIALCFVFLSFIFFRRKIISVPLFLIGFALMIALPFLVRYVLEQRFYKVETDISYNKVYNYSDVYQYIAEITNVGKRHIAGCVFSHQILYDTSKDSGMTKYKHILLNYVKPRHIYNKDIPMDLQVGQSVKINEIMEDYKHRDEPFITKIECYGKGKHNQKDKILVGYVKPPKAEPSTETTTTESTSESSVDSNMESKIDSNVSSNVSNIESSPPTANIESSVTESNVPQSVPESNVAPAIVPTPEVVPESTPPNTQSNAQDSTTQDSTSQDSTPQDSINDEEAKKEEARKQREARDNFNVPMLKEMPR